MFLTYNVAGDGHGVNEIALNLIQYILRRKTIEQHVMQNKRWRGAHLVGASEKDRARLGVFAIDEKSKWLITNLRNH